MNSSAATASEQDDLLPPDGDHALVVALARLLGARERTELCERIVEALANLVPCDELLLYTCSEEGERRPVASFSHGHLRPIADGRGGETAGASAVEVGTEAMLALPLEAEGTVAGELMLRRDLGRADFTLSERARASDFASLSALALVRCEREEALAERARRDWLTGLYNHGHCRLILDDLCARHARFALLLLDLDDLKLVNDSYGHPSGDDLLRAFGQALPGAIRRGDLAFRVGGDEFLLLLPGAGEAEAGRVAARIEQRLPQIAGLPAPAFSYGITVAPAGGKSPDELLRRVDSLLYEQKRQRKRPPDSDAGVSCREKAHTSARAIAMRS